MVYGVGNEKKQTRLLGEAKLTYEKAMQLALSMETAAKNLKEINTPAVLQQVLGYIKLLLERL